MDFSDKVSQRLKQQGIDTQTVDGYQTAENLLLQLLESEVPINEYIQIMRYTGGRYYLSWAMEYRKAQKYADKKVVGKIEIDKQEFIKRKVHDWSKEKHEESDVPEEEERHIAIGIDQINNPKRNSSQWRKILKEDHVLWHIVIGEVNNINDINTNWILEAINGFLNTPSASDINPSERTHCIAYRIIRDTRLSQKIKQLNGNYCQICGKTIKLPNVTYSEAHHIHPIGRPHNGPDTEENIIVLCPNCHVMCDYGAIELNLNKLKHKKHRIDEKYINYHNEKIYVKR